MRYYLVVLSLIAYIFHRPLLEWLGGGVGNLPVGNVGGLVAELGGWDVMLPLLGMVVLALVFLMDGRKR